MTHSKLYTLEGIILSRRDHGEADRVITLLTATGRSSLLAKGIRKPQSRKAGHLELFSRATVLCSRVTGSWDIISQAEAQAIRFQLHQDMARGAAARYVAELALRLFEEDTDEALYTLVDNALAWLERGDAPDPLLRWYEQQILTLAGFRPDWSACVGERDDRQCERLLTPRPADSQPYGIDVERGGALCPDCWGAIRNAPAYEVSPARPLSPSALSWLQAFQRRAYAEVVQFTFPERTANELARVMEHYITYHLERRPATLKLLR